MYYHRNNSWNAGSSPLARGLLKPQPELYLGYGIIPARAGFTITDSVGHGVKRDHPRSRGVYSAPLNENSVNRGSSPLARGLRRHSELRLRLTRIIPARAGFTRSGQYRCRSRSDHPRSRGVYLFWLPKISDVPGSSPLARGLPGNSFCISSKNGIIPARAGFTTLCE